MDRAMATQFETEAMHYRQEAVLGSVSTSRRVPPPPLSTSRHRSGSHRPPVGGSQAVSQASSSGSVRQSAQPLAAPRSAPRSVPSSVPPLAPEGEGESAT